MTELESLVKERYKKQSARQIAAELGASRTEIDEIIQQISKTRRRKFKLGAGILIASLGIGGILFSVQNREDNGKYWVPQAYIVISQIKKIGKLDETPRGILGKLETSFEEFARELDDPILASLNAAYRNYRQNPVPEQIGPLLSLFGARIENVKKSPALFQEFQLLSLAKRVNNNYAQEKNSLLAYFDNKWKEIYDNLQGKNFERGGYIIKDGAEFRIVYADMPESKRKLLTRIIDGDVRNYQAALKEFEGQKLETARLNDIINYYVLGQQLVEITGPYISDPQAKKLNESGKNFMQLARKILQLQAGYTYDLANYVPDIIDRTDIVVHWHSHPEVKIEGLSQADLSTSFRIGAGVVFELTKDGMLVFDSTGNKSTLLREYKFNK